MRRLAFLTLEDRADFVIDDALAIAELERRSIRVDEVLTCCPPGPPEREVRKLSSLSGIVRFGLMLIVVSLMLDTVGELQ